MKTLLSLTILICSSLSMFATSPKFNQKMGETLGAFAQCTSVDSYQKVANQFQVIANIEQQEWLPLYYQAQCYVLMGFMEVSAESKDLKLDEAEKVLDKLIALVPNESEVYTLQSMFFSARLVVNPKERGQQYSMLSNQAIGKALALSPNNPRARYMQIQNELGLAYYFKQDVEVIFEKAQTVYNEWDDFMVASPLHPNWGKNQLEELLASGKPSDNKAEANE